MPHKHTPRSSESAQENIIRKEKDKHGQCKRDFRVWSISFYNHQNKGGNSTKKKDSCQKKEKQKQKQKPQTVQTISIHSPKRMASARQEVVSTI